MTKGIDLTVLQLDRPTVMQESLRVYEICDGCRRCFNLCPSFNTLFERIDSHDSDATDEDIPDRAADVLDLLEALQ